MRKSLKRAPDQLALVCLGRSLPFSEHASHPPFSKSGNLSNAAMTDLQAINRENSASNTRSSQIRSCELSNFKHRSSRSCGGVEHKPGVIFNRAMDQKYSSTFPIFKSCARLNVRLSSPPRRLLTRVPVTRQSLRRDFLLRLQILPLHGAWCGSSLCRGRESRGISVLWL